MRIANPIYDTVFKYLMENVDIAKDILSAILNEEIVSIETKPQETAIVTKKGFKILRFDFNAKVRYKDGAMRTILIEIQKAKKGFEIPRFRRYLGENYIFEEENFESDVTVSLPLTAIYFLGYRLKNLALPVFKIDRVYMNGITQKKLKQKRKEDFVELLSHDMYVIQIPRLKKMVTQSQIEKILDVFSQTKYMTDDKQILDYAGDMSDPRIARIIRYLNRAIVTDKIRREMDAEDEVEQYIDGLENRLDKERKEKEEERKAKEEERKAKEEALAKAAQANSEIALLKKQLEALLEKGKTDDEVN